MIKVKMGQADAKKLRLRDILAAQSGDINSILSVLSNFIYDEEGNKLPADMGKDALLDLTMEDFEMVVKSFQAAVQDGAVPPASATSSNTQ